MGLIHFLFALGVAAPQQVIQPYLPGNSDKYCLVDNINWHDGKQYDAVVHLQQVSPEGLQIEIGKRFVHPALKTAKDMWPYATQNRMSYHINGNNYGDNTGDVAINGDTVRFGGKNPTPINDVDKKTVSQVLATPECGSVR